MSGSLRCYGRLWMIWLVACAGIRQLVFSIGESLSWWQVDSGCVTWALIVHGVGLLCGDRVFIEAKIYR